MNSAILHLQRRARRLASVMSWRSVWRILTAAKGDEIDVHIRPLCRSVMIRAGTSDLACLEKAFIENSFAAPYPQTARVIVDGGANIGAAALYFSHRYPDARIFAIEPEQSNFTLLQQNCSDLARVVTIQAALWPESVELRVADPNVEKWEFSVMPGDGDGNTVRALPIGDLLKRYGLDFIDILKLDIEGAELQLFDSPNRKWLDKVGLIIIELHDRYRPGCSRAFYAALQNRMLDQEIVGENLFVRLSGVGDAVTVD